MALQDLHIAHWPLGLPAIAVLSGRTAHKLPVKISALIARIIVAHIVKEAKRSPSQHRSDSGRPLTAEMKQVLSPVMKVSGSYTFGGNISKTTTV
jgi:hypothetical protein